MSEELRLDQGRRERRQVEGLEALAVLGLLIFLESRLDVRHALMTEHQTGEERRDFSNRQPGQLGDVDPAQPDGPERFVAAYRHIADAIRGAFRSLGGACRSCHDQFRVEQD